MTPSPSQNPNRLSDPSQPNQSSGVRPASKVLIIGLDGASWSLLDPLISEGKLPCLAKLISKGTRGVLESTIPPVTASAWSSLYTGRSPGHHGVYDFRRRMGSESTKREWVTHCDIRGPKLWEIASAQGKTAGLINLPLTFPPSEVNGYVIGGMPVPPTRDEIGYPPGLVNEVVAKIGEYVSDIDLMRGKSPDVNDPDTCKRFVEQVARSLDLRWKATEYLMTAHPTDLTACVFIAPDRLSHLFWKILVPDNFMPPLENWEKDIRSRMIEVLQKMDNAVGALADRMSGDDLMVMMSDHGFGPLDHILKLNRLLNDIGFLKFCPGVDGGFRRKVGKLLPESLKKCLRPIVGQGQGMQVDAAGHTEFNPYALIDWGNTRAYSGGSVEQGVFINVVGREPHGIVQFGGEYHKVRDELIEALRSSRNPDDKYPIFDWVEPRENIYSGECIDMAPDIIYCLRGYRAVVGEDAELPMWGPWAQPRAGFHRREGVFVSIGPMIKEGMVIEGARIQDVAPTILACWGLESDINMDGEILKDLIKPDFLAANPPKSGDYSTEVCTSRVGDEDSAEMEDLLKGLGYLN